MTTKKTLCTLILALLTALPQGTAAQQTVAVDPAGTPVSYVRQQSQSAAAQTTPDPLLGASKVRSHRRGGTYTAAPALSQPRAGLKDLLRRQQQQPLRITGDQVRRAARQKAKAPFAPDNDHRHLIVNVVYNSLDETKESGLFALDVTRGCLTCLASGFDDYENYGFNGGGYVWNGKYRGVFYEQGTTVSRSNPASVMDFDMTTWEMDEATYLTTTIPYQTSMAIECATEYHADGTTTVLGQFWGVDSSGNLSLRYATLDDNGLTTTRMGEMWAATKHMLAMGVTSDGRLYGVAKDGNLYQVDRATGHETLIGHTGISDLVDHEGHFWLQGGEIDPRDDTFYWVADHASVEHSLLCSVDLATGKATVLIDFVGDVECAGMVIAPQQRQSSTPAAAEGLTAAFAPLQLTGSGSFTAPTTTFDGTPLAADAALYYHVYVNDVRQTVANNQTAPGALVSFNIEKTNVVNNSANIIRVTTSATADGEESVSATATAWVGYGIPEAPRNAAMTFDEATNTVTVSWEHPTRGDHAGMKGGVVDNVSYFVYKVVDGERAGDITNGYPIMDDVTQATYTLTDDDLAMSLSELSFEVEAWSSPIGFPLKALASEPASTGGLTIGKGKTVPYLVDFGNDFYNVRQKEFTIIDGNGDGKTWKFYEPHLSMGQQLGGAVATSNYSTTSTNDDWLITPGIALEAGKTYHFKSNMHGPSANVPWIEHIEVLIGAAKTSEAMTAYIVPTTQVVDYCAMDGDFTVPEDGNYYIGLHAVSAPNQWEIAVFDISVTDNEGTLENQDSPAAGLLAVTPEYGIISGTDDNGNPAYLGNADIELTLPATRLDGAPLGGTLLDVSLTATRGETTQTLAEYSGQAPGAVLQYKAQSLPSGEYTFGLYVSYTADGIIHRSPLAVATGYVGWDDKPARPVDAKVVQSGDKLMVRFSPDEQLRGAHGAYLPSVSYRAYTGSKASQLIYYAQGGMSYVYDMIAADAETDGTELVIPNFDPSEGMQYNWTYYVLAVSKDADGNNIYSDFQSVNAVIGEPRQAPVMETGDQTFILDGTLSPELYETWNYWLNRGAQVCGIQPIDDQFGLDAGKTWDVYSAFNGELAAQFGKVDISDLTSPVLAFDLILEDTDTDLDVVLNGPDGLQATHRIPVMDGIRHISIPLDEYQSWGWVQPVLNSIFHLTVDGDEYHDIYFDNVGVYDALPRNLSLLSFEVPEQLSSGQETMVNVTVMNMGQQDIPGYSVTLKEDDAEVQCKTVSRALKPGATDVVQFRYRANTVNAQDKTGMEDAEKVLVATISCEDDGNADDNTAEAVLTVTVVGGKQNSYPTSAVARQEEGGAAVSVSWSFDMEQTTQRVTESFEDYELWYTGGVKAGASEGQIGPWRLYDGDGKPTYTWQNLDLITPYAGDPQAFQVFSGSIFAGMDQYYTYDMDAVSGSQYLVSMDPADGNYIPKPDDYLISPPVRGGSMYGRSLRSVLPFTVCGIISRRVMAVGIMYSGRRSFMKFRMSWISGSGSAEAVKYPARKSDFPERLSTFTAQESTCGYSAITFSISSNSMRKPRSFI